MLNYLKVTYKYGINGFKECVKLFIGRIDFMKFKDDEEITVFLPNYKQAIYLRRGTSDYSTFKQIYVEKEYNLNYRFEPEVIIDAGANIGLAGIYFSQRFPNARVFSIEPESSNIKLMKRNIAKYPKIEILENALYHSSGEHLDIVDSGLGKWGFVTKIANSERETIIDSITTIGVYDIMIENAIEYIDILKIDIEGAEKELFERNFDSWLPKTKCLIIELHDRKNPGCTKTVFNAIERYNFSRYKYGENHVFFNEDIIF